MARKRPPALARIAVAAALTVALASCGGGNTGGPVAQSTVPPATSAEAVQPQAPAPPFTTATAPATPRTTASARTPSAPPAPAGSPRPSGGAGAPSAPADGGSLADAPAAAAGEPSASAPEEREPQPAPRTLDERARLVLTRRVTNTHYFQQGTITGTWDGTMELEARITARGVLVRFTATLPGGTISGRGVVIAILDSATWPGLRGRAVITGGTGRFAGIQGSRLKVTGRAKPDASRARVRLAGTVRLA